MIEGISEANSIAHEMIKKHGIAAKFIVFRYLIYWAYYTGKFVAFGWQMVWMILRIKFSFYGLILVILTMGYSDMGLMR